MTPQRFLKTWLPNYWDRYREYLQRVHSRDPLCYRADFDKWIEENFDEALEEFAKAQRIACMDAIGNSEGEGVIKGRERRNNKIKIR